jgi:multidrug efflux pump subunit AcrB
MSLQTQAIDRSVVTIFAALLVLVGGAASYFKLGQLEDPEFTIKTAIVVTGYPGASPLEVEQEVTDRIEIELQKLKELDSLESFSQAGFSRIKVNIKASYPTDELPQIWDKVRARVSEVAPKLPPGAGPSQVIDDFGDVFGLLLAVTGDGYSPKEVEQFAKSLKRELSLVDGVGRVDLWGVQRRVVYLEVMQTQLSQLGISEATIADTLQTQNVVIDAGELDVQDRRLRVAPTGAFESVEEIVALTLRPNVLDRLQNLEHGGRRDNTETLSIGDIGHLAEGYEDPPETLMRVNGRPAIGLAIANRPGVNVVNVGRAVDARLAELVAELPIGIEATRVHWQSDVIDESVRGFFINLAEAVIIVLAVLTIPMGWRMGMVIGSALVLTVAATLLLMALFGIDLQRMSLGALVIALGMMVDNAIVVADGYVVRLAKGMGPRDAAIEASSQPSIPLLGATVIAVMAFYPIFASDENAGEYCATLFSVVAISLLASWVISITVTPLQCMAMLKGSGDAESGESRLFRGFRRMLLGAIRFRLVTIAASVVLLVAAFGSFDRVTKLFFPDSAMTKFMIDFWAPQGTRIDIVSARLGELEQQLLEDERVVDVASFVGAGPPRFYLPVEPESNNSAYGQVVVNVRDFREINGLLAELGASLGEAFPEFSIPLRKFSVGPGDAWKFEIRISGPADADPSVLRAEAEKVLAILRDSPYAGQMRTDWRERVPQLAPQINDVRARWAGITREDLARTVKRTYDGVVVGLYREADDLIPIVMRNVADERGRIANIDVLPIRSPLSTQNVPVAQVTDHVAMDFIDPIIARYNRRPTITVQANPVLGETFPTLRADVVDEIEALDLPPGYRMAWGGEFENSSKAQTSLIPGVIPAIAIVLFTIVWLFNDMRPPIIILLTIPFVMVGVIFGLLFTNTPFGFVALLGAMSLAGMMIKNALVLLDEIDLNIERGLARFEATVEAAVSRLRPVVLAAATTVLGVIPLLQDVFWVGLAVTIMAGLSFGTVLTMILVPVLYATIYRLKPAAA